MVRNPEIKSSWLRLSDGEKIHALHIGTPTRPCLFFYHSVLTNAAMWEPQIKHFSDDYFIVVLDSRGHGKSEAKQWKGTADRLVQDVPEVMAQLDVERAHFVGLSLGGIIGFGLAEQHPQCLESLFVSSARPDGNEAFRQPWPARSAEAREHGVASLEQETLKRWFPQGQQDLMRQVGPWIRQTSLEGFEKSALALQGYDYSDWALGWQKPTTLLVGDRDGILPEVMAETARTVPQAAFISLSNLGHLPNLEDPERFNQALATHLTRTML